METPEPQPPENKGTAFERWQIYLAVAGIIVTIIVAYVQNNSINKTLLVDEAGKPVKFQPPPDVSINPQQEKEQSQNNSQQGTTETPKVDLNESKEVIINHLTLYSQSKYADRSGDYVPFKEDRVILAWDIRNVKSLVVEYGTNSSFLLESESGVQVLSGAVPDTVLLKITGENEEEFVKKPSQKLIPANVSVDEYFRKLFEN